MKNRKRKGLYLLLLAVIGVLVIVGCADPTGTAAPDSTAPTVLSTVPVQDSVTANVAGNVKATFSEAVEPGTIIAANFTLNDGASVSGSVIYDPGNMTAVFSPSALLANNALYTATVTIGAKDLTGNALEVAKVWTFTTAPAGIGPAPVRLGTAGDFVILAKTGVSTVPASVITGNVGLSPAAESFMTGFSQTDATGYATSPQVTGYMYAADMTAPTPTRMTTAIADMEAAYSDAAGRTTPDFSALGAGEIGGLTLTPGLHNWTTPVTASSDFTISGAANDVWIFQTSGDLSLATGVQVILAGQAQAQNIFWQVAGSVTLEASSHFEGIILGMTDIAMKSTASMNGRALAQTAVTLIQNTVTQPAD